MSFARLKNHLETAATNLEATTGSANDDGLTHHVITGLRHMGENLTDFEKSVTASRVFLKSFTRNLRIITDLHSSKDRYRLDPDVQLVLTREVVFSLFEELAVFFKEKNLAENAEPAPVESELLAEFENSSNWSPADNGMVCKFYYCYLPGVANGLFSLEKVKELSELHN